MRKLFTFLFAALMSVGMWAEPIVVTWNNPDISGSGKSFTKDGVTITCGGIDWGYPDFYGDGTFTTDLGNFTKIEVTADMCDMSGEGWESDDDQMTWTGNATSVSFHGGMYIISSIVFTIEPKGSTPTAIENTNLKSEIKNHKLIKDGQLIIEQNGKTYNVQGLEVR